jgi:PleD family two-component response regulator
MRPLVVRAKALQKGQKGRKCAWWYFARRKGQKVRQRSVSTSGSTASSHWASTSARRARRAAETAPGHVPRILIADHDLLTSVRLENELRANGYATTLAGSGQQAQRLGLTGEFDLLILDMGLPDRQGLHVLRELRAHGKTMPILVTGGDGRDAVTSGVGYQLPGRAPA